MPPRLRQPYPVKAGIDLCVDWFHSSNSSARRCGLIEDYYPEALIALTLIPAAAKIRMTLAAGRPALTYQGAERLGVDALLIVAAAAFVVLLNKRSRTNASQWHSRDASPYM
jgi:hypothetical protein